MSRTHARSRLALALLLATAIVATPRAQILGSGWLPKVEPILQLRPALIGGRSRVIVRATSATGLTLLTPVIRLVGGTVGRSLPFINGLVAEVPNAALPTLAGNLLVAHISLDRQIVGAMERTGATVGAADVREAFGYDGSEVGIAIIDSGVSALADDLADAATGSPRVDRFVDFVGGRALPYDDYGHGAHVAGIVAGNGFDSDGARTGIAPAARIVALKVLDEEGRGRISDAIAAIAYAIEHRQTLNIRVINLSIASGVYESYNTDPLTVAARRAVDAGIVVVAAAGNNGRGPSGGTQYGGVTAPGNAPWVLTVGASSHMGTTDRADDAVATFSSRGPTAIDHAAKPDLVAPGVGIESLSAQESAFYSTRSPYLLNGTRPTNYMPYLSLSGTSMAAPVVSGTIALMLQANPQLTPDAVKAILEYTAQSYAGYDHLTQGAGFLNAKAAVGLARQLAWAPLPSLPLWSLQIITAHSSGDDVFATSDEGDTVVWGTSDDGDTVVWGTSCTDPSCEPVLWGEQ